MTSRPSVCRGCPSITKPGVMEIFSDLSDAMVPVLLLAALGGWFLASWKRRRTRRLCSVLIPTVLSFGWITLPRVLVALLPGEQPEDLWEYWSYVNGMVLAISGALVCVSSMVLFRLIRGRSPWLGMAAAAVLVCTLCLSFVGFGLAMAACEPVIDEMRQRAQAAGVPLEAPEDWPPVEYLGPSPQCRVKRPFLVVGSYLAPSVGWHYTIYATTYLVTPLGRYVLSQEDSW
jgi:hypothetical protein